MPSLDATLRAVNIGNQQLLAVIDRQNANLCLGLFWWERIGSLPVIASAAASIVDMASAFHSGAPVRKLTANEEVYLVNGWDANKIWDGTTLRNAGSDNAPAPTIAAGSGTGLTGDYTALYTYYDSARVYETGPAAVAPTLVTLANKSLAVTVVASTDSRFDKIRIYRNATGVPGTYRLDTEVSNASQTVQLTKEDAALGMTLQDTAQRPPVCKFICRTATRIFWGGSRPWTTGTAKVTNGSTTVELSEEPPQDLYTRDLNAPFYFQRRGGPRYGVTAISGKNLTLTSAYKETSEAAVEFVVVGLRTRIWYADLSASGTLKAETWPSDNYFNVGLEGDGAAGGVSEEITGLVDYANRIYAVMREGWWYFDPLIRETKRTPARMGTLADKTIMRDRDGHLLFCGSDQQVYAFDGVSTVCISGELRNRFSDKNRYNLELAEFAFAYYDEKEGLYVLNRPAAGCTLSDMKWVQDVYDDYRGKWVDRAAPRLCAATRARDTTRHFMLGIDTLGIVHVVDAYDLSSTYGADAFTPVVMNEKTSVAGEISPGSDCKGKLAIVYGATSVKGSKLIVSGDSVNALVTDLNDPVTVVAGDKYIIGGWHGRYETAWMDQGQPDFFKSYFFLKGTLIKGSSGLLFISYFVDESTTAVGTLRIDASTDRVFKRHIPCRGRSLKLVIESVTELVGFGIRELSLHFRVQGDAQ